MCSFYCRVLLHFIKRKIQTVEVQVEDLEHNSPSHVCWGISIMRTFSMTKASKTKGGKDTKSAKTQKKYLSSVGKMTQFNMSRMIKKEGLLDSITHMMVHLALT